MANQKHKQLAQEVTDLLRDQILDGTLMPGEWLRQERIARECGVSQMPVREALKRLAAQGLVEHLPYRGIRVVEVSKEDAEDLFFCRAYIEGRAARFAAVNMTWDEMDSLLRIREDITRAIDAQEVATYQRLNHSMHDVIIRSSRRPLVKRALDGFWTTYPSMLWPGFRDSTKNLLEKRFVDDEAEHDAIVNALKNRDPEAAEKAMRRHIQTSAATLLGSR